MHWETKNRHVKTLCYDSTPRSNNLLASECHSEKKRHDGWRGRREKGGGNAAGMKKRSRVDGWMDNDGDVS